MPCDHTPVPINQTGWNLITNTAPLLITISGALGAGKTVLARRLADTLDCLYVSTGAIQRSLAQQVGLTTLEYNKRAEASPAIDAALDDAFTALVADQKRLVIDSRLAWHRLPASIKIYLTCDERTAAARVAADVERTAEHYQNASDALQQIRDRRRSEVERYKNNYGVDISDFHNYDIVLRTDDLTVEQIHQAVAAYLQSMTKPLLLSNPWLIFPTAVPGEAAGSDKDLHVVAAHDIYFAVGNHALLQEALTNGAPVVGAKLLPAIADDSELIARSLHAVPAWETAFAKTWPKLS
jgi:cytidylate kinase